MKRQQNQQNQPRAVHANIKRLREALDLTQAELGARVGRDKTVVSHWEMGKSAPALEILPAVAKALDVTVDELLAHQKPAERSRASRV